MLERARGLGLLGPGPVDAHLTNAAGFAAACVPAPSRALDLGSGGGVPGLILALLWPMSTWVLLDAARKPCDFLQGALEELGLTARVRVWEERAESAGRHGYLRATFDLVTARSFAPPAPTAECAAPFLRLGGVLLVSEPPAAASRWAGVGALGLTDRGLSVSEAAHIRRLEQATLCPERFARRVGIPGKRPLW
ncbi:MAG: 16S rRNA (guanine(527)-N(7))-methyltransferase RsmG [Acidimicrobiales bacterium]